MKLKQMIRWQVKSSNKGVLTFVLICLAIMIVITAFANVAAKNPAAGKEHLEQIPAATIVEEGDTTNIVAENGIFGDGEASLDDGTDQVERTQLFGITTLRLADGSVGVSVDSSMLPIFVIFVFVLGVASVAENLRFSFANGVSRRTNFKSFVVYLLMMTGALAVLCFALDLIPLAVFGQLSAQTGFTAAQIIVNFSLFLFVAAFGYLLAALYYRFNRAGKAIVTIGVPAGLVALFVLSVDKGYPLHNLAMSVVEFLGGGLLNVFVFWGLGAAVCLVLAWLLLRRAEV